MGLGQTMWRYKTIPIPSHHCITSWLAHRVLCRLPCRPRYEGGLPRTPAGDVDYKEDFFGKPAYLTVSGQLQVCYLIWFVIFRAWFLGTGPSVWLPGARFSDRVQRQNPQAKARPPLIKPARTGDRSPRVALSHLGVNQQVCQCTAPWLSSLGDCLLLSVPHTPLS